MRINASAAAKFLREGDSFLLLCHRDPDGDTYGSATALADALLAMGKRARIECPDEFPPTLSFLRRDYPDFIEENTVAIDVASPNMLGDLIAKRRRAVDLCIDHHPTNPDYANQTFVEICAATGELIYRVLRDMDAPISPFCATALYTALSADTGGFRFANTTAQTHRFAADLLDLGADAEIVRKRLFESNSRGRVKIESQALANARYYHDGAIAVISVTAAQAKEEHVEESGLEGLASEPLCIEGVRVAITLKQREDGSVRVSMRSDSDKADVSAVCRRFGGGGHVRASGCRFQDSLEAVEAQLIAACEEEFSL